MSAVLHNARLVDPASGRDGQGALWIDGGRIADVAWGAAPGLPALDLVLVNPGMGLSTPDMFAALQSRSGSHRPLAPAQWATASDLAHWLGTLRNDFQPRAIARLPPLAKVLDALVAQPGCLLARMSGSGATCFGVFADASTAQHAQQRISAAHPSWWTAAART